MTRDTDVTLSESRGVAPMWHRGEAGRKRVHLPEPVSPTGLLGASRPEQRAESDPEHWRAEDRTITGKRSCDRYVNRWTDARDQRE